MTIMLASFVCIQQNTIREIVYEGSNFCKTVCQKLTPNRTELNKCRYKVIASNGKSMQITGWKKTKECIEYAKANGEIPDMNYLRFITDEISFERWFESLNPKPVVYGKSKPQNDYNELNFRQTSTLESFNTSYVEFTSTEQVDALVNEYLRRSNIEDAIRSIPNRWEVEWRTPSPIYGPCENMNMFMDDMRRNSIDIECERNDRLKRALLNLL